MTTTVIALGGRFVEHTGRPAAIGRRARAADVLAERSGTWIGPDQTTDAAA